MHTFLPSRDKLKCPSALPNVPLAGSFLENELAFAEKGITGTNKITEVFSGGLGLGGVKVKHRQDTRRCHSLYSASMKITVDFDFFPKIVREKMMPPCPVFTFSDRS